MEDKALTMEGQRVGVDLSEEDIHRTYQKVQSEQIASKRSQYQQEDGQNISGWWGNLPNKQRKTNQKGLDQIRSQMGWTEKREESR